MAENIVLGVALFLAVIVVMAFELSDGYIAYVRPAPLDLIQNGGIADHPAGMTLPHNPGPWPLPANAAKGIDPRRGAAIVLVASSNMSGWRR